MDHLIQFYYDMSIFITDGMYMHCAGARSSRALNDHNYIPTVWLPPFSFHHCLVFFPSIYTHSHRHLLPSPIAIFIHYNSLLQGNGNQHGLVKLQSTSRHNSQRRLRRRLLHPLPTSTSRFKVVLGLIIIIIIKLIFLNSSILLVSCG